MARKVKPIIVLSLAGGLFFGLSCGLAYGGISTKQDALLVEVPREHIEFDIQELKADCFMKLDKNVYFDVPLDNELQDYIFDLCEEHGVDPVLVMAVIKTESNFQEDIISVTHDYGLMQINKSNEKGFKKSLGITDLLNPYDNVLCGITYLGQLLEQNKGDVVKSLMCYNMGTAGASKKWKQGITSTNYTRKVLEAYELFKTSTNG